MGTFGIVPKMRQVLHVFRLAGKPIIHAIRIYNPDGSNVDLCRRRAVAELGNKLVIAGTQGAELVDELKPSPPPSSKTRLNTGLLLKGKLQIASKEWIMYKLRWGTFYATQLEKHLHELNTNTVIICGCNFTNCPRTTVYESRQGRRRIMTADDCIAALK
jgi:nicotinamidase-related amidase